MRDDFLRHHGIRGMKWGIRKYQNEDGSLTAAGKSRYKSGGSVSIDGVARHQTDKNGRTRDVVTTTRITKENPFETTNNGHTSISFANVDNQSYAVKSNGSRVTLTPVSKRSLSDRTVFDSNGQMRNVDFDYTGRAGVSMDEEQAYNILTSSYADLSDEELDKLYELTGDVELLKYRNQRHTQIIKAGEEYVDKNIVGKAAENVSSLLVNYTDKALNDIASFTTKTIDKISDVLTTASRLPSYMAVGSYLQRYSDKKDTTK